MDDVVCYFTNPECSIRHLKWTLEEFGPVSGYKINQGKTVLMGFNLCGNLERKILDIMPCKWFKEGIRYLGILIGRR